MEYVIAVLSSRTQTMSYFQFLKRIGVPCSIVDTPKEISKSCGVCVKFPLSRYVFVKSLSWQNYSNVRYFKYARNNFGKISVLVLK